jgi:MoaA/NifB/PqqE/SkfB family radical SAM enzyme
MKNTTFAQPSFNFLSKILKEAGKMGVEMVDLTGGGEPFIRKDIIQVMKLVKEKGMKGTITTNSTLIRKSQIEEIVDMEWDEVKFSLDGSSPEINDYIRGKGTFNQVLKKVKTFQDVKKKKPSSNPVLRLCFTITKTNFMDIPNYIKLARKLKINDITFSTLFEWETNKEFWLEKKRKKEIIQTFKKGIKVAKEMDVKTNLQPIARFGVWEHSPPKFCFAPWYMLFINANREAMVCCTLASLYQNKLGEVKSLKEVWFGEKMKAFRKRMKKRIFFKECKRCLPEFTQLFNELYEKVKNGT